jgi:phosphomethylpyrimidine synthase
VDTDFCAMCGHDWCSVRISKEIIEFASGKAQGFERGPARKSDALTDEQRAILEKRGVLAPEELLKLASKTKRAMEAEAKKGSCHSDLVDDSAAKRLQSERLVELRVPSAE